MRRIRISTALIWLVVAVGAAIGPASASGDGLPVPGGVDTTHEGVLSPDGSARYLALPHDGGTLVERIDAANGVLQAERQMHGEFVVPGVTIDGDTAGLARDESALVLIHPRESFPQRRTSMAVLDPRSLRPRRRIELDGDFSFDAISPDGKAAFLIQYPNPRDPSDYRLRELDLDRGRLLPGAIRPQNDPAEEMRGFPLARATGTDGRWEYTLYDGGALYGYGRGAPGEPFVHAIDTVAARTLCIDLGWISPRQISRVQLRLAPGGAEVEVVDPVAGVVGAIDTSTGEAREAAGAPPADAESSDEDGPPAGPAGAVGLGVLVALALATLTRRRRRHRSGGEAPPARA